eukprot:COSAG01_NODE_2634_length_7332_cov_6393.872390_3_plen_103_part_00
MYRQNASRQDHEHEAALAAKDAEHTHALAAKVRWVPCAGCLGGWSDAWHGNIVRWGVGRHASANQRHASGKQRHAGSEGTLSAVPGLLVLAASGLRHDTMTL